MSFVTTPESTPQNKTQVAAENIVKDTKTTDCSISEKIAEKKAEEERLAADKKAKEILAHWADFEIHLRGNAVDSEGYKSVKDIVICEIPGNKNFKRNYPYSFYNSVSRYWMMNGL